MDKRLFESPFFDLFQMQNYYLVINDMWENPDWLKAVGKALLKCHEVQKLGSSCSEHKDMVSITVLHHIDTCNFFVMLF